MPAVVSRSRARTIRFTLALTLAIFLAGMLVYTTFSAASPERFPSQLAVTAQPEQTYRVGGRVQFDSASRPGGILKFRLGNPGKDGADGKVVGKTITITYAGTVPDTFREGRDIIIDVKRSSDGTTFVGQGNSLLTKCPSKFNGEDMNADTGPVDKTSAQQSVEQAK
ncbi:MAG: cytochrome c maturation protein CcmE [Solirubrobacteraceae bacterium]|nr:cytochrome c maturation protein CcmE [Solirubrobacteraceae bacterium]